MSVLDMRPEDSVSERGQADRDPENRAVIGAATTLPSAGVQIARALAPSAIEPGAFSETGVGTSAIYAEREINDVNYANFF